MPQTTRELMEAYRRSGISLRGYSYQRAIETPSIYTSLCCMVRARRVTEQRQHGEPAPVQRALI